MGLRKLPEREALIELFPHIPTEELDRDIAELEELFMASLCPDPEESDAKALERKLRVKALCEKYNVR